MYSHNANSLIIGYCGADWAANVDDINSTSGGFFFLGNNLISWFRKKQNCVSLSMVEARYIAAGNSCSQLIWMKQMLEEDNVQQDVMTLYYDNLSAINIPKNPIQHNRTKHIYILHHFIRDLDEDKIVTLEHVATEKQLTDIFTKAMDANQFKKFRVITDFVPLSLVPSHGTPIRKPRTSASRKGKPSKVSTSSSRSMAASNVKILEPSTIIKKPHSMTSPYLDPINVEPNVDASEKCPVVPNVMENVEASKNNNKPRSVTTLSKCVMISSNKYGVDKNIRVLISQVLDKSDVNMSTQSPEKYEDKEDFDGMSGDLADKEENYVERKDQSTNIMNIDDLDSDDEPIGKRLAPGIAKMLKNKKGKAVESSSTSSKSLSRITSVGTTKGWSKVVTTVSKRKSLKRKQVPSESSEFFHDIEHNVQDIVSTTRKRLALEIELVKDALECKGVMSLIQEARLMKIVIGFSKCYEMLVKEFIVNIFKQCDNKRSKEFRKVYVRGRDITAKQVKEWPRKGKLSVSYLSVKYASLHRIGVAIWVPINHTSNIATGLGKFIYIVGNKTEFDFGSYVFDQTMKHAVSFVVKMPIAFPTLICGVILSQHPSILLSSDSVCKRDPSLSLHYRLFIGKYVQDIVMTYGRKPSRPTTRTCILADLKDTYKTLNETITICTERKSRLEIMINALSKEEGNLKGDETSEEDSNEEGANATDDEENTSSDEE
ncbi:uncharacterized protein LOC127131285 [Lathyrus oleraceus]|uniref:uncharacterized protein LOC127131285 n=1 Tax=Pisum sativum TaxID=3888 RepID=UPI0021CF60A4|nr:uncharacterized protein LOC127131285 [Pisum sativum]